MSVTRPPVVRAYSCRSNYDAGGDAHAIRAPLACVYVQRFMQETEDMQVQEANRLERMYV